MVALAERRAHVGVPGDAAPARDEIGGAKAAQRDPVSRADVGREPRRPLDDRPAVGVVPAERPLAGVAGELDPDRVRVAATRVPGDVLLADALDDRCRRRRSSGRRPRRPGSRTTARRSRRRRRARRSPSCGSRRRRSRARSPPVLMRALDERIRHAPSRGVGAAAAGSYWYKRPNGTALGAVAPRIRAGGRRRGRMRLLPRGRRRARRREPRRPPRRARVRAARTSSRTRRGT